MKRLLKKTTRVKVLNIAIIVNVLFGIIVYTIVYMIVYTIVYMTVVYVIAVSIHIEGGGKSVTDPDDLLHWFGEEVKDYNLEVEDFKHSFSNGMVLCAIIHRYLPQEM